MLTVILLGPRARAILGDSKMLFAPFEQNGRIALCDWDPAADTVVEAMPGLERLIRGQREWRVVVVVVPPDEPGQEEVTRRENPFDFVMNAGPLSASGRPQESLNLERSRHSLVRIAHLLLGYPDMGAKGFEPVISYLDGETGDHIERRPAELVGEGELPALNDLTAQLRNEHRDVRVGYREVPYTQAERDEHAELRDWYASKSIRPSEVVFLSTREPLEADPRSRLDRAWQVESDQLRSRFVDRNDYPPSSRFAVFDLVDEQNPGYALEVFRFWLSVLTVAINRLPPSSFQAERVYQLRATVDEDVLATTLNDHLSHLAAVRDHVAGLSRRPVRPPDFEIGEVITQQHVAVEFTELGGESLAVPTDGYGMASDRPRSELTRWQQDYRQLRLDSETFVRKPRRVLSRAVYEARRKADSVVDREVELSAIQRDELEEGLRGYLPGLTQPAASDILNRDRFDRMLAEHSDEIEGFVHQRMSARVISVALTVVLAATLIGFLPFIAQAGAKGPIPLVESTLVVVLVLAALAATALITLLVMRWRLLWRVSRLNSALSGFVAGVTSGATAFESYLSTIATYVHGRSVLRGASRQSDRDQQRRRRLSGLHRRIVTFMDMEKEILVSLAQPITIHRGATIAQDLDLDDERRVGAVFQFPISDQRAKFNDSGDDIQAPYDFVTKLLVERLVLIEPAAAPAAETEDVPR